MTVLVNGEPGLLDLFFGYSVFSSPLVREGEVLYGAGADYGAEGSVALFVGPLTLFQFTHGRLPFETRFCRGILELDRDRRRYPRPVTGA